ncbi:hypothetical protein ACXDF8_26355 [Mycolicibacterium sp. CBM1]
MDYYAESASPFVFSSPPRTFPDGDVLPAVIRIYPFGEGDRGDHETGRATMSWALSIDEAAELATALMECVAAAKRGEYSSYGEVLREAAERSEVEDARAVLRQAGELD